VASVAVAVPFVASMNPSARARAAGAPVEVDLSKVEPGMMVTVEWRGQPVWVVHRTREMIDSLPKLDEVVPIPILNADAAGLCKERSPLDQTEYLVLVGICTHLGCSPSQKLAPGPKAIWARTAGRFLLSLSRFKFDLAGRVYKGVPAPRISGFPVYLPERHASDHW